MREVIFIKLSKRFPSVFIFSAALAVMIFSVLFPAETAEAAKDGLSLCAEKNGKDRDGESRRENKYRGETS